ncbi:MAG: SRPBCC family protein [Phenylobacterium sp.]|nr:SRPBCC family protein [Phenylobacterium sp.]MBP8246543.1 SRPBCC family protein [Phenylobacterium sp.]
MTAQPEHVLVLERIFEAPPEKVFQAWTDPAILPRWFAPRPFTTPVVDIDPRPGGKFNTTMRSEDGTEYPNSGIYLEVTPNRKLVTTDAFTAGWIPSGQPFMVSELTFEPLEGGRTKYTARAMHWNAETKAQHEAMGFHAGWGQCADQLAEVLATM